MKTLFLIVAAIHCVSAVADDCLAMPSCVACNTAAGCGWCQAYIEAGLCLVGNASGSAIAGNCLPIKRRWLGCNTEMCSARYREVVTGCSGCVRTRNCYFCGDGEVLCATLQFCFYPEEPVPYNGIYSVASSDVSRSVSQGASATVTPAAVAGAPAGSILGPLLGSATGVWLLVVAASYVGCRTAAAHGASRQSWSLPEVAHTPAHCDLDAFDERLPLRGMPASGGSRCPELPAARSFHASPLSPHASGVLFLLLAVAVAHAARDADACSDLSSCLSCNAATGCGWCQQATTIGLCLQANASGTGPLIPGECDPFQRQWLGGSTAWCAAPYCEDVRDCNGCVRTRNCNWCGDGENMCLTTRICLDPDQLVPYNGTCPFAASGSRSVSAVATASASPAAIAGKSAGSIVGPLLGGITGAGLLIAATAAYFSWPAAAAAPPLQPPSDERSSLFAAGGARAASRSAPAKGSVSIEPRESSPLYQPLFFTKRPT